MYIAAILEFSNDLIETGPDFMGRRDFLKAGLLLIIAAKSIPITDSHFIMVNAKGATPVQALFATRFYQLTVWKLV